ncbi:MAG: M20/M25/M40 family metallo-hydrolase [Spirochaetia bacterium]
MNKQQCREYLESQFDAYVQDLEKITNIDSQHKDPIGNQKINAWLRTHIAETGGQVIAYEEGGFEHLVGRYEGSGEVKIALIVHIDTVLDNRSLQFSYDPATKIAKGPGVGDCKASVVMAMYLIQAYQHFQYHPFKQLSIYYDAEEEGGSELEKKIVEELAKSHDYVLVADTGRPDYGIVVRRKSSARVKITVEGINGHGGNALQAGANALYESGFLMTKIFALQTPMPNNHDPHKMTRDALLAQGIRDHGQFIPENSVTIRSLTHSPVNIPDHVEMVFGLACFDSNERDRIAHKIQEICKIPHVPGCKIKCEIIPVMQAMVQNDALNDLYRATAKEVADIEISDWQAGGLTMANIASQFVPTIDAVGVDCDPLIEHTVYEEIDLKTVVPRLLSLFFFIDQINEKKP